MTQNWTDDVFASSHNGQTDLQNMENNFQTLKSLFEGTSAPANTVAGHPWFDSGKDLLRIRNAANGSWYGLMHADASQEIWVYRNDAMSGWVINSNVADKVLAIKGGSQAYNVTAGQTAGTWQQPGHTLTTSEIPSHNHYFGTNTGGNGGHRHSLQSYWENTQSDTTGADPALDSGDFYSAPTWQTSSHHRTEYENDHAHSIGANTNSTGGDGSHNHGSTYRPNAAVGTLQRMDV